LPRGDGFFIIVVVGVGVGLVFGVGVGAQDVGVALGLLQERAYDLTYEKSALSLVG
jgi:hypothetical protein